MREIILLLAVSFSYTEKNSDIILSLHYQFDFTIIMKRRLFFHVKSADFRQSNFVRTFHQNIFIFYKTFFLNFKRYFFSSFSDFQMSEFFFSVRTFWYLDLQDLNHIVNQIIYRVSHKNCTLVDHRLYLCNLWILKVKL